MVGAELDVCPNCSNPFPAGEIAVEPVGNAPEDEPSSPKLVLALSRPFKFILLFLLSFIAVLAFIGAERLTLNGSTNSNYLFGDLFFVSLIALFLTVAFMFIDYMIGD